MVEVDFRCDDKYALNSVAFSTTPWCGVKFHGRAAGKIIVTSICGVSAPSAQLQSLWFLAHLELGWCGHCGDIPTVLRYVGTSAKGDGPARRLDAFLVLHVSVT